MALSSVLVQKLYGECSLEEKIQSAKRVYSSSFPLTNKKEIIFNWLCNTIEQYFSSENVKEEELSLLWNTFKFILRTEEAATNTTRQGSLVPKSSFAECLSSQIRSCARNGRFKQAHVILDCTQLILLSPTLKSIFTLHFSSLLQLLSSVLEIVTAVKVATDVNQYEIFSTAVPLLSVILNSTEMLHKECSNQDEVFYNFLQIMEAAMVVSRTVHENVDITEEEGKLNQIIVKVLFSKDQLKKYDLLFQALFYGESHDHVKSECTPQVDLFKLLHRLLFHQELDSHGVSKTVDAATYLKKLLCEIFKNFRDEQPFFSFHLVVMLTYLTGFQVPLKKEQTVWLPFEQELDLNSDVSCLALENILHACAKYSQLFIFPHKVDGKAVDIMDWFLRLEDALLDLPNAQPSISWFGCFDALLSISPSIIEAKVVHVLKKCLLTVQVMDQEVSKRQTQLLVNIFSTYSSLRQIPKLMSKLFIAMNSLPKDVISQDLTFSVPPMLLQTFKKCIINLPVHQTLHLWQNFLDNIKKFTTILFSSTSGHHISFSFHLAYQLFLPFLLHARIGEDSLPSDIIIKVEKLMNDTKEYISETLHMFKNKYFDLHFQGMILMLSYVWGEVHLMLKVLKRNYCSEVKWPTIHKPLLVTDLSVLHNYLTVEEWTDVLIKALQAEDRKLIYPVVLLYLQKVKALNACNSLNNSLSKSIKVVSSEIISILLDIEWNSVTSTWNKEVTYVTSENYLVALWNSVLVHFSILIPYLGQKEISNMCIVMMEIILDDKVYASVEDEEILQLVISKFLSSNLFSEVKSLQTAFISALLKYIGIKLICSKKRSLPGSAPSPCYEECIMNELTSHFKVWATMAETVPKHAKLTEETSDIDQQGIKLNNMWMVVKNASEIFNTWLETNYSPKRRLNIETAIKLIKVLNYLPLEYLLPGNQVRCLLGISVLLVFVGQELENEQNTASHLLEELCKAMVAIFEGVRSVWLFDFVKISSFLKTVVIITGKVMSMNHEDVKKENMNFIIHKLLDKIVSNAVRHKDSLQSMDNFISEVKQVFSDRKTCFQNEAFILSAVLLVQKLVSILQQKYIQEDYKNACHRYTHKLFSSLVKMINNGICKYNSGGINSNIKTLMFTSTAVILEYTFKFRSENKYDIDFNKWLAPQNTVAEIAFHTLRNESEIAVVSAALCVMEKMCAQYKSFGAELCRKDFFLNAWSSVQQYLETKANDMFMKSRMSTCPINYEDKSTKQEYNVLNYFTEEKNINESQFIQVNKDVEKILSNSITKEDFNFHESSLSSFICYFSFYKSVVLTEEELNILSTLMKFCTDEEFLYCVEDLLKSICEQEFQNTDEKSLWMKLHTLAIIIDAHSEHSQKSHSFEIIQKIFTSLHNFENKAVSTPSHVLNVLIPILHFISEVLKKGKKFLPQHEVIRCLHFCSIVPLTQFVQYPAIYCIAFEAVCNVLNEMLIHHLHIILAAGPPFIACVSILLKSVISASNQDLVSTYNISTQNKLQLCAQNITRLLTQLSEQKTEFSKVVPYIIADYVDRVQHITVHPCIKPYLIAGVNRVLDICSEHAISMLYVTLHPGSKEIFKVLYNNYNKNFRYQGKV